MNDFVLKPVNPEDLYNVLLRWLSNPYQRYDSVLTIKPPVEALTSGDALPPEVAASIPAQLLTISGLNAAEGIALVNGDVSKYCRLLRLFVKSHSDDMKQVQACLVEGNNKEAQNLTHRLKGVAATLSVASVSEIAAQLEMIFYLDDTVDERIALARQCDIELTKLARIILSMPEETGLTNDSTNPIDHERSDRIIAELKNLLAENNIRASKLALESADLLRLKLGSTYSQFIHQVNVFDFESALKTLQEATCIGLHS